MRRMSNLDAQFLAGEAGRGNFGAQYCGLSMLDTEASAFTAADLKALVAERIDQIPPLRWKVVDVPFGLGNPVFVKTDVDLDAHITESTLPAGADEHALSEVMSTLLATRLDRTRPLWAMHLVHGIPGRTGMIITLHHAMADGISGTLILDNLLDPEPSTPRETASPRPVRTATETVDRSDLLARSIAGIPRRLVHTARTAPAALRNLDQVPPLRGLPGVQSLARRLRSDTDSPRIDAPRTRFNAPLTTRRNTAFGTLSLGDVKAIKNALCVTINDVVVAMVSGGLRRRLIATGELPETPLVAYVPISVRPPEAARDFGNAISSIIAPLPTALATPAERLAFTRTTMERAKQRTAAAPPTLMSDVNNLIPPPLLGMATRGVFALIGAPTAQAPVNLILSNVTAYPRRRTIGGHEVIANYPLGVVFDGFALNITVVSYEDSLDIGISGDAAALPDAWHLVDDIRAELAELTKLIDTEPTGKE